MLTNEIEKFLEKYYLYNRNVSTWGMEGHSLAEQEKKKVVLISTGGTIASKKDPKTGLLAAGALTGEELSQMCELTTYLDVEVISVFQIPSIHMTFDHLLILKEKMKEVFKDEDVAGIVVTHGTDTLEETSYFLDLTISDHRPVVVTGSQRGPTDLGTDAFVNLRQAIMLAANEDCQSIGTIVLFNERIFSARYVRKAHASNLAGFTSFGFGYLGIVDGENIFIYQKPIKREIYSLTSNLPYVEIIKYSLGSDGRLIRALVDQGAKGIILEAPGRGHVHPSAVQHIQYAIQSGIPVILTTNALEGEVKLVYDFAGSVNNLQSEGVVLGRDFDSKKARIRLAVMLASGVTNIQEKWME